MNEATLYRCFGRKRDLFTAALETELGRLRGQLDSMRASAGNNGRRGARDVFEELARVVAGEPELVRLLQFGMLELGPGLKPLYRRHLGDLIEAQAEAAPETAKSARFQAEVAMVFLLATVIVVQNFYSLFAGSAPAASAEAITAACAEVWSSVLFHGELPRSVRAELAAPKAT